MKSNYRISEEAINDLSDIWVYTFNKWSKEQADRYYSLIYSEIEFISANFKIGKPADYIKIGYRSSIIKSHIIFYKKAEDGIIEIVRILHQSMDEVSQLE